jgi:uncharacterized protein
MEEHPNVARMRTGYEAFAKGDLDSLRGLFAEDLVWHVTGNNILSGDYKGHDEVFGFFGRLVQETGGNFSNDVHHILADDEHASVRVTAHAERNGKTLDEPVVHVFDLRDGKVTEFWTFGQDTQKFDDFWS